MILIEDKYIDLTKISYIEFYSFKIVFYAVDSNKIEVLNSPVIHQSEIKEYGFVSAKNNVLVNILHVKKYKGGSQRELELTRGKVINISRRNVFKFRSNEFV